MSQQPDSKPGAYYVTVVDGKRLGRLLGPFVNNHSKALSLVDDARRKAEEIDPRACWYSFGTARYPEDDSKPGILNQYFGLPA